MEFPSRLEEGVFCQKAVPGYAIHILRERLMPLRSKKIRNLFFVRLEIVLAHAADRAHPIFGNVFKSRARLDARLRIAHFRVIDPLAHRTDILLHRFNGFKFVIT